MDVKTNLNDIADLLLPLNLSAANERCSSRRKRNPPSRYRGVCIIHSSEKKTHSLQVKGLFYRAGTDHLKRLKIMDQLGKRLKKKQLLSMLKVEALFWGVWEHARPEKF